MDENEINTLYAHIRAEKVKLLENRKRKVRRDGSNSGSIEEKRQKHKGDESDQFVSSSGHDTKNNDRGSSKDDGNKPVEDNHEFHYSIDDLLTSSSNSETRPYNPQLGTKKMAPESHPDSSTMPNTTESYSCSESTWGSSDQIDIDIEVTSSPPTRQNSPISQKVDNSNPTSK